MTVHFTGLVPLTHIHDRSLSWLGTPNTHIHDCTLNWLGTPNTHIHDCTLYWLGTGTSIKKSDRLEKFYWYEISTLNICVK
jgi:hypothetical protein